MSTQKQTLRFGAMTSVLMFAAAASAQRAPENRDVVSITAAISGGHFEGGQSASAAHAFLGVDLDARYYLRGEHGIALRGFTGGTIWGGGSAHTLEARYSYRLATDQARTFGPSLSLDVGAGAGSLEAHETPVFSSVNAARYQEHYLPVYGVAAVRGDLHIAAFDVGLELGVRAGAMPLTSHSGDPGPRLLGGAFVSPYLGVRIGSTFAL